MLDTTERQVAPTIAGIRPDHVNRYKWAAERLAGKHVVDAGCGVGYGSAVLAEAGCTVRAYDKDAEAIAYAEAHYNSNPNIKYTVGNVYDVTHPNRFVDAVVAFEILEHVAKPERALRRWREMAPTLLLSVPNEDHLKYGGRIRHHARHYTPEQIEQLLLLNGWRVKERLGQKDILSEVEEDVEGRTIVLVAEREDAPIPLPVEEVAPDEFLESLKLDGKDLPRSIAIVAMGSSMQFYWRDASKAGGIDYVANEVWGINMLAGVGRFHRLFHQDDLKIQEARRDAADNDERRNGFQGMLDSIKEFSGPVYTSRAYEDYPNASAYPLEWVANTLGTLYINSTVAAALCLALAIKKAQIDAGIVLGPEDFVGLYGCDFAYPYGDRHKGEKGRACVEFWLGWAAAHNITIKIPPITNLLDMDTPKNQRVYGYDTEWLTVEVAPDGTFNIGRVDRAPEDIPTGDEMDRRYSHDSRIEKSPHLV